jgi:alkanesulfonate monooxygenase SsuD/methylene tetrahydromethanopterin reductase-like flavin-dependent oxidoreductase (luciferase family)
MELDIILEADLKPAEITELGLLAEKYGFRAIWAQNYARARDAFMSVVPLAEATNSIRVGVVIVSPYEMHPLKIANATMTLNEYCNGRAAVVIGAGGEWPGVLNVPYGRRVRGAREAIEIVKGAIREPSLNYKGEVYQARGFAAPWHEVAPPQVYDGASGPQMLRMAAAVADGVMMSDIHPEMFDDRMPLLKAALVARGADAEGFRISNFVAWHVKGDREESFDEARRELIIRGWLERDWLVPYINAEEADAILANKWPFLKAFRERHGNVEGVPQHVLDQLVEGLSLAGDHSDIDRHVARLHKFADAGFTEIALRVHDNPADAIRVIGDNVLPALR